MLTIVIIIILTKLILMTDLVQLVSNEFLQESLTASSDLQVMAKPLVTYKLQCRNKGK